MYISQCVKICAWNLSTVFTCDSHVNVYVSTCAHTYDLHTCTYPSMHSSILELIQVYI